MVIQAQEYAARLEQAQDTIHNLSEPKLLEDDELSSLNNYASTATYSVSSFQDSNNTKESEITKGPVFSAEFRQEMQKEIERNLNLRNEIRHRIITVDNNNFETGGNSIKKKGAAAQSEGLKYLVSENAGLASLSTSTSSSTNSSILSTVMKKEMIHTNSAASNINNTSSNNNNNTLISSAAATNNNANTSTAEETAAEPKQPILRPQSFLTGFGGFGGTGSDTGLGNLASPSFITRGIPPRTFTNTSTTSGPSISTRFFQRIASRFDDFDSRKHTN
jgi:hypothetical protein